MFDCFVGVVLLYCSCVCVCVIICVGLFACLCMSFVVLCCGLFVCFWLFMRLRVVCVVRVFVVSLCAFIFAPMCVCVVCY